MIAFATAITDPQAYERFAAPGIERAAEPGGAVHALAAVGSGSRSHNLLLDVASAHEDLEALVIVQQDTEITDAGFCRTVRRVLADRAVGVAGCMGATGIRGIAWWEGRVSCGPVVHRYYEHGGGELAGFPWAPATAPLGEVDAVDGCLLALSPWVVRNVRFDETLNPAHGCDVDFCRQVRGAGRKVVTADLAVRRHRPLELVGEPELWTEAHINYARKWETAEDGASPRDWTERARRAEAERDAARTVAYSNAHLADARAVPLEQELDALTGSLSWRLTAPLRRVNDLRRRSLVGQRAADRRLRDDRLLGGDPRPVAQPREALGD
jgi:GT2 family glycosyltransferase